MRKKISFIVILSLISVIFLLPVKTFALTPDSEPCSNSVECSPTSTCQHNVFVNGLVCTPLSNTGQIFGKITPPEAIQNLGIGSFGISKFLNNLVILIYSIASVVFVFMILWSGMQWMLSGGDKEAIEGARNRLTYALIGIVLFAVAFAVIMLVGRFTGFEFFV